jgi:hypothetical protein
MATSAPIPADLQPPKFALQAYPGDYQRNVQVRNEHGWLTMEPGPLNPYPLIARGLFVVAFAVMGFHWWGWQVLTLVPLAIMVGTTASIFVTLRKYRRQNAAAWIELDRSAKVVRLPRQKLAVDVRAIVRMQVVRARMGPSTAYQAEARTGELQIVWNDGSREQTRCVIAQPRSQELQQFLRAFEKATHVGVVWGTEA